ncbi:flagellar protein FlgN [Terasakiella pusilla]|jgi:hypothetical protein|uniref:flagellar protein FlgN n=1 Tax=Terasakiella pusilla TaxID=64973 RepID=UPI000490F70C|nr:flagellar protein FlgN [Terasakiella pusilla]
MDINDRVAELTYVCERMIEILQKENDALDKQDAKVLGETFAEKDKLSRLYERHCRALERERNGLADVDEDARTNLKKLGNEMDELVAQNARILKMNIEMNRRVLYRFADVAKKMTPHAGTYAQDANIGVKAEATAPISLNETL